MLECWIFGGPAFNLELLLQVYQGSAARQKSQRGGPLEPGLHRDSAHGPEGIQQQIVGHVWHQRNCVAKYVPKRSEITNFPSVNHFDQRTSLYDYALIAERALLQCVILKTLNHFRFNSLSNCWVLIDTSSLSSWRALVELNVSIKI